MNKIDYQRAMDRLALLVRAALPDDQDALQELVSRDDWQAPHEAREIVRGIYWAASADLLAFVRDVCGDADDPEVLDAWLSADPTPGVRWGRDHRLALVINHALLKRDIPTGDWSWHEWMRVAAGKPMPVVEHRTPGGEIARRVAQGEKSVRLSLRETELLEGAIRTAVANYRQRIPAAHLAEQADLMAVTATMLVTANLETLQDDLSRANAGAPLHGPIGIAYSDDDSDGWDQDAHELTLVYDSLPTSPAYLTLLAIYQANLHAGHNHAPTMKLLGRLI